MKEKLKTHFLNFGPRKFVTTAVIVLFILDVVNCYYLKLYWMSKSMSDILVQESIKRSSLLIEDFSRDTLMEMTGFVNNTFFFFLLIILANNLFFYFFYLKKRLWAQGYVLFYTLTAALFSLTFIFDNANLGVGWIIYNVLTIFVYIYLYFGVKLLKNETVIIPVSGKKGR